MCEALSSDSLVYTIASDCRRKPSVLEEQHKAVGTYKHSCTSRTSSLCSLDTFMESAHGSLVALIHTPRLAKQDPSFVAALTEVTMLNSRLKEQRSFRQRPVLRKQLFRLLQ